MANAYQILAKDYRIETNELIKPIYEISKVGNIYPIVQDLKPHSLEVRYFTQEDDPQYRYNMESEYALSHIGYTQTDTATPVITVNLHYGYDELQRVQDSTIPLDSRVDAVRKIMVDAQERICLTGSTVALDDIAVTSVDTTGTNSTAQTTAMNFTTYASGITAFENACGQLIDGLGELGDPLALVCNADVYKKIRSVINANTDTSLLDELNRRMKAINAASPGVLMSKYLTATVSRDYPGDYAITGGTGNVCLFNINPQYYRIHTSPIEVRSDPISKLSGLHIQLVQRFRPVYIKPEAIIYEDAATIS
jgi:hypothetical protein